MILFPFVKKALSVEQNALKGQAYAGSIASLFSYRSLRVRLIFVVLAIDAFAALVIGAVVVWKARTATRVEISSAMQLAESVVADTIGLLKDAPTPTLLRSIDFHFQSVRHVRIVVQDGQGTPVEQAANATGAVVAPSAVDAPAWFRALIAPAIVTGGLSYCCRRPADRSRQG